MDNNTYEAVIDAKTAHRLDLPVSELQHLAKIGDETSVSGDALAVYSR